jgi:hypothetical protein
MTSDSRFIYKDYQRSININLPQIEYSNECDCIGIDFTFTHVCYKMLNLENIEIEL